MKSAEIRKAFLNYFKQHGHTIVPSSSLIPADDPTLLFVNAGMVQFKDVFLGRDQRPYSRATTSQRCVRAGGKHNDLENVGYTARHHTFFEMLGNFSFGDYFKEEAINFAWTFLTKNLKIPVEKLWVTVFEEDDEAADIWLNKLKVDPKRFSRCGEKDNFWAMGEVGPCGPCSEIFYDHGPEIEGGPPGSPDEDGDRYIEIWNLVFMQYNRDADGKMKPLPKPSVDTGMGLERIAAVLQGVHNNYDIDLFQNIIKAIAKLANVNDLTNTSLRVIADHIRSCAFLMTDGVTPSNEGRGYVLRRIIRRALRHGNKLGLDEPFFHKLVAPLIKEMGDAYPELVAAKERVQQSILREEVLFETTLEQGLKVFDAKTLELESTVIPGELVFMLYDTYGFPMDLTADIARERGLTIDEAGFHKEMNQQRLRSAKASQFVADYDEHQFTEETDFTGYEHIAHEAIITAISRGNEPVEKLNPGEEGIMVLNKTPFYAESGGQVGDHGVIRFDNTEFEVIDTQKQGATILHIGKMKNGIFHVGDNVEAKVNTSRRQATALNHSTTHLLNAALRQLLGEHVLQKGSLVEPERLRFDFSHFEALHPQQLHAIEQLVNEKIRANLLVETQIMTPEEAMDSGAIALFGEKYGAEVRVLKMGDFSLELCGGTHVRRTGDIGLFKIISETGIAAGIRRIEAVTGEYALAFINDTLTTLQTVAELLKVTSNNVTEKLQQQLEQGKQLEKQVAQLKKKLASGVGGNVSEQAKTIGGVKVLASRIEDVDPKTLRELLDQLKQKLKSAVVVLATVSEYKVHLVAGVTKDLVGTYHAGELIKFITAQINGQGGGRPDMAQGGGSDTKNLPKALESVYNWVKEKG